MKISQAQLDNESARTDAHDIAQDEMRRELPSSKATGEKAPHYLRMVYNEIESTHTGLGKLGATAILTAKAKKMLMTVAVSGCGKSVVTDLIASLFPGSIKNDKWTPSTFNELQDKLNNFRAVLTVDDLGSLNEYMLTNTLVTTAELNYRHERTSITGRDNYAISNFWGGVIVNIQPVIMTRLLRSVQWDSNLQDKMLRYYHLYRPTDDTRDPSDLPDVTAPRPGDSINVTVPESLELRPYSEKHPELLELAMIQWSRGRAYQHMTDLLKAAAYLDGRDTVTADDYTVLEWLLAPMRTEYYLIEKNDFEGGRKFNHHVMYLMVEWASYGGSFSLKTLCEDYKIKETTAYNLLEDMSDSWYIVKGKPTKGHEADNKHQYNVNNRYFPAKSAKYNMVEILKGVGVE